MTSPTTLYLVDGSGYIFRAFYAIQPLSTSNGLPTNALIGFSRMLLKLLRDVQATHIAVMFDTPARTFRHEMYEPYKANRSECPEDLVPQMPYFRKIVHALGIPCFEKEGFEADDIIGTLTHRFQKEVEKVVIVSGDKDLTQLVGPRVEMWDAMRDIVFDEEAVLSKFGIAASSIVDYLALTGDSSDNIPGVRGIGPKTAVQLIQEFGSVEGLIERLEELPAIKGIRGAKSAAKKIADCLDELKISKELVQLDNAVAPYIESESLEEMRWSLPPIDDIAPIFEELEFSSFLSSLEEFGAGDYRTPDEVLAEKIFALLDQLNWMHFSRSLKSKRVLHLIQKRPQSILKSVSLSAFLSLGRKTRPTICLLWLQIAKSSFIYWQTLSGFWGLFSRILR